MAKGLLKNYTFSVAAKTITLTNISTARLDKLALITNTTTNKILYNFADSTISAATVAANVITLSVLQGGETNGDKLRIDYDVESSDTLAFADTIQPILVLPTATDNGLLSYKLITAATTNATNVKASAGKVYLLDMFNSDTVGYWVKMYNKASAPTVGTDVPVATRFVPAGGGAVIATAEGIPFTTGIAFGTTLNATDSDTTVVTTANKLVINIRYI
jgi:hypothetical protein